MISIFKNKPTGGDQRRTNEPLVGGRRQGENENPYLAARRTWNDQMAANTASRQMWQLLGILSLLIALAGVGGIIHIGSKSKIDPYLVEVDKLGQFQVVGPAQRATADDPRIIHAGLSSFVFNLRMVSPDIALQRKAVFAVYSMLSPKDTAFVKTNEYLNGTPESSPFKRAEKEMVNIEIATVIQQTPGTWQIDWIETVRDRQGVIKDKPFRMRALITTYTVGTTPQTTEKQLRDNPLGIYVRDFSWSKQIQEENK